MDNASNITNKTWDKSEQIRIFLQVMTWTAALEIIFTVVGTFLNLWLLGSILTSRDLRVRMRNQLICNLSILNLVQTVIKSPAMTSIAIIFLYRIRVSIDVFCQTFSITTVVEFIQSFIGDWLMVFVIIIFIAHILDFDATAKLTPRTVKICKVVMHIAPWIAGIIITFISVVMLTRWHPCLIIPYEKMYAFEIAYTIIPTILSIVLLVVAFVLRQRRFSRGTSTASGHMGVQLLGRGPEIDR
ncbi:LOW QUALITY PROTEIN: hypothetical protein PoB_002045400 [Plakobranchus ocellatus]|uniref:G-protein coupled receptors family 1 profile domain-containing protein n=1 Tax=Plakobranchus ocellatus TaxID=259542 RepID=A0AAV3ZHS0_9GAST|nr:LOW QUALITY PROTEIN: hypothetical protein PoB_002045400 [Plakobranchus ocellatus]